LRNYSGARVADDTGHRICIDGVVAGNRNDLPVVAHYDVLPTDL